MNLGGWGVWVKVKFKVALAYTCQTGLKPVCNQRVYKKAPCRIFARRFRDAKKKIKLDEAGKKKNEKMVGADKKG